MTSFRPLARRVRDVPQLGLAPKHAAGALAPAFCAALGLGVAIPAAAAPAASAGSDRSAPVARPASARPSKQSLLHSRELWASVDVCNPTDQPDTIGVRGSMPGDGSAQDTMYMDFQLQYLQGKNSWVDLTHNGSSGLIALGSGKSSRQGGSSFQLMPVKGKPAYTMRGLVTFEWRRGTKVLYETTRTTSAGHQGVSDADPPGYSAADCTIR